LNFELIDGFVDQAHLDIFASVLVELVKAGLATTKRERMVH